MKFFSIFVVVLVLFAVMANAQNPEQPPPPPADDGSELDGDGLPWGFQDSDDTPQPVDDNINPESEQGEEETPPNDEDRFDWVPPSRRNV